MEGYLKLWREKVFSNVKRKEISPGELSSLFQNPDLQYAFFKIMDHDNNNNLSEEEWIGSFLKLLGNESEQYLVNWFLEKYDTATLETQNYLEPEHFKTIVSDSEFGYRFAALIAPKQRRVTALQLITSLEIIASLSTDAKWLTWLKYQFTAAMSDEERINKNELHVTLEDFKKNFFFKEPFLAARLFNYLDTDHEGYLSLHKFINGLEVVVNGTQEEKMAFLFKVFDTDNDGRIDMNEMKMMLKCCLEDFPSLDKDETVDELAMALFIDIDTDGSGDITIDELKEAFKRHQSLFKSLSVSTSIWIKPKYTKKTRKHKFLHRAKEFILNNRSRCLFWSFYVLITLACMLDAYVKYANENPWIILARMFGNPLNFNCTLILALVLRKHSTWLRTKGAIHVVPIDDFIEIHKKIGIIIAVQGSIHTLAHCINLFHYCRVHGENYWEIMFTAKLNLGYPTGVIDLILLIIIIVFALPIVRKNGFFQLFYCVHMLTIPWLLIMLFHGKSFWVWLLLPAICYTIEFTMRFRKTRSHKFGDTFISEIIVLPSKVIHLVIRKPPKFHYKPGDYVFICIPMVAKYEWHPFSISSAPERSDYIWLHIRVAGNWTRKLYDYSSMFTFEKMRMGSLVDIDQMSFRKRSHSIRLSSMNKLTKDVSGSDNKALDMETLIDKKMIKPCMTVRFQNHPSIIENAEMALSVKDSQNIELVFNQQQAEEETDKNANNNSYCDNNNNNSKMDVNDDTTSNGVDQSHNSCSNENNVGEQNDLTENSKKKFTRFLSQDYANMDVDDELGYLRMYKRSNRLCAGTIGVDECWRLKISIDGPYGTPTQQIFDSEHAVLIAAGIGITPFASVLQSMMNRFNRLNARCNKCSEPFSKSVVVSAEDQLTIRKVDFIWVTREQRSLEWFISLLSRMEIDQRKNNVNFLDTHLYVTSAKRQSDLKTISLHITLDAIFSKEESTLIDGLRRRTYSGRPNWDIVFQNLIRKQKGKIDVFYCGPPNLGESLQEKCNEYRLHFNKEVF